MKQKSLLYLTQERTLFVGTLDEPLTLSQGAATLCVSLNNPIQVQDIAAKKITECTSVLIPPGSSVRVDTHQQVVANLNLDVMGFDFKQLSEQMSKSDNLYFDLSNEEAFVSAFINIHATEPTLSDAKIELDSLLEVDKSELLIDKRVQTVIELIQSAIGDNLSIEYLAEQVNLSVPGLTKLFKKLTGVPIRRYRQWHRLYITANEIGRGKSLTEAALAAGFVDLPHCTHTFNLMLGMKPSYFLMRPADTKIITEQSNNLKCF